MLRHVSLFLLPAFVVMAFIVVGCGSPSEDAAVTEKPETKAPKPVRTGLAGLGGVSDYFLSADGTKLVTCHGGDQPLKLWDFTTGEQLHGFGESGDTALGISPDGQYVIVHNRDWEKEKKGRRYDIVETATGKQQACLYVNGSAARCVGFSHDGTWAVMGSSLKAPMKALDIVDVPTGRQKTMEVHSGQLYLFAAFSPVEATLAVQETINARTRQPENVIRLYDLKTLRPKKILAPLGTFDLQYSLDGGTLMANGGRDAGILLLDAKTGEIRATVKPVADKDRTPAQFPMVLDDLAISPDGTRIALCATYSIRPDGGQGQYRMEIHDVGSGEMRPIRGVGRAKTAFLPNGTVLLYQGGFRVYDSASGELSSSVELPHPSK